MTSKMKLPPLPIIIFGAIGGITPTLVRYAADFVNDKKKLSAIDSSVLVGLLLLALLGAAVAASEATTLKQALLVGASLRSLFTVITQNHTPSLFILVSAHAAENPDSVPGRKLRLELPSEVSGSTLNVVFIDKNGRETTAGVSGSDLAVPDSASNFRIEGDLAGSPVMSISTTPNSTSVVSFSAEKTAWYGLKYALGIHARAYNLTATRTAPLQTGLPLSISAASLRCNRTTGVGPDHVYFIVAGKFLPSAKTFTALAPEKAFLINDGKEPRTHPAFELWHGEVSTGESVAIAVLLMDAKGSQPEHRAQLAQAVAGAISDSAPVNITTVMQGLIHKDVLLGAVSGRTSILADRIVINWAPLDLAKQSQGTPTSFALGGNTVRSKYLLQLVP